MSTIVIKSYSNGRVRLASKKFTIEVLNDIENKILNNVTSIRINPLCKSIIINFNETKINLKDLLLKIYSLLGIKCKFIPKEKIKDEVMACANKSCSSCGDKNNFKKSVITFAGLSIYSLFLMAQEHFGLFAGFVVPIPVQLGIAVFAGIPLFKGAIEDLKQKKFTLKTFMSLTLIGAVFIGEVETAFEVIYILRGGMLLEEYAARRSKAKIHELLESDIKKAFVLVDDVELECELSEVKENDIVVVRSGEKIPVDGVITWGSADISESLINGRSEPSYKEVEDIVYANTLVEKGRIFIKVSATGSNTYLAKTIVQVEKALANRSESEKAADRLAAKLLKLGIGLTISTFLLTGSLLRAFSVMVVMSCPCSTILAASTAISSSVAKGAKEGILIKGGEFLEKVSQSDVICFDKTGTLTTGKPLVSHIHTEKSTSVKELFKLAATAEYRNSHPIALAINNHAKGLEIEIDKNVNSEVIPGMGAKVNIKNDLILVGNSRLFKKQGISIVEIEKNAQKQINLGKTVVYVGKNKNLLGFIAFEHEAREGAKTIVKQLKNRGVKKVVLLTGDEEKVAHSFGKKYGFDKVYANVLPQEKAEVVEKLKKDYRIVTMIGDGINDTIAMGKADVGISFASGGSEAAVEISDISIVNSDIYDVVKLYDLSKTGLNVANQNYWIGTSTNLMGVVLAGLGILSPVAAGGIHIAHTIGIMANASRIALIKNSKDYSKEIS